MPIYMHRCRNGFGGGMGGTDFAPVLKNKSDILD